MNTTKLKKLPHADKIKVMNNILEKRNDVKFLGSQKTSNTGKRDSQLH